MQLFRTLPDCSLLLHNQSIHYEFVAVASPTMARSLLSIIPFWIAVTCFFGEAESRSKCNLSHGRWLKDFYHPLYGPACPLIDKGINCKINRRRDADYQTLAWVPHNCEMPRFDPDKFIQVMRGKKILFVGDCISRSMFQSLICMLYEKYPSQPIHLNGESCMSYNVSGVSIMFMWSPMLVKYQNEPNSGITYVNLDEVDYITNCISGHADIVSALSSHWWTHNNQYYSKGYNLTNGGNRMAFRRGLTRWAKWAKDTFTPQTQVFYFGISTMHNGQCGNHISPLTEVPSPEPQQLQFADAQKALKKFPFTIVNITGMTALRVDAHPSTFLPNGGSDCSHWCLPGVPDAWNEMLFSLTSYDEM